MSFDRATIEVRLAEQGIPFERVALGVDASLIVSERGARIYGPFLGHDALALNWAPDAFGNPHEFARLIDSGAWNIGGERLWIGPEIAFMIPDRSDYWGSYVLPPAMDPGVHRLARDGSSLDVASSISLASFTGIGGRIDLDVQRTVRAAANPLRHLRNFARDFSALSYAGYSSEVTLSLRSGAGILAESWNLNQVAAGGIALVPTVADPQVTDYYEPVGPRLQAVAGGIAVHLTGADRFKVGFSAANVSGRLGHLSNAADGSTRLVVRSSTNDPSSEYSEEPDFAEGLRGDSLHLYNDDGGLGGFAELESRGHAVGSADGFTASTDRFTTWWFSGAPHDIARVSRALLGIDTLALPAFPMPGTVLTGSR